MDVKQDHSSKNEGSGSSQGVSNILPAVHRAATGAAGTVVDAVVAVGADEREALRLHQEDHYWRIHKGDTYWNLSEKHLGNPFLWRHLRAGCWRELGWDPNSLLPGSYISEKCIDRARRRAERNAQWWQFWI